MSVKSANKFGAIYNAAKVKPAGVPGPVVLMFLDKVFTWIFGRFDQETRKFVVQKEYEDCAVLYWTPIPPTSIQDLNRKASV
ncbi:MAG: hypothetical protein PHY43_10985 [Verrucomicrobiales bacterium]|nr:hypothetical protein [Verrucomicrobiales bacterium]